jgi:hypothetical protein
MKNIINLLLIFFTGFLISCGGGIEPEPEYNEEAGFGGTVYFSGTWPDSITRTHIVTFRNPLNSLEDFNILNLAFVSPEIPYGSIEFSYSTLDSAVFPFEEKLPPGTYSYIAVAQQKTAELSLDRRDWFVIGYYMSGTNNDPARVVVPEGRFINDVDINCDFSNPPPQPPGGVANE